MRNSSSRLVFLFALVLTAGSLLFVDMLQVRNGAKIIHIRNRYTQGCEFISDADTVSNPIPGQHFRRALLLRLLRYC
jgi:hypothetical protein